MKMLKTIISILTSMQLMFMQVVIPIAITKSLFTSSKVYAQDSNSSIANNFESSIKNSGKSSNEDLKKTFPGMKDTDAEGMMGFIMTMIMGLVLAGLVMCKKKSVDIYIAFVGGAIYILGEVMQLIKTKDKLKTEEIEYQTYANGTGKLDNEQIEAFEKQKQGLIEAKEATLNKIKMQKAAGVVLLTAAAVAVALGIAKQTSAKQCLSGAPGESATNPSCQPAAAAAVEHEKNDQETSNQQYKDNIKTFQQTQTCASCGFFSKMVMNASAACTEATKDNKNLRVTNGFYDLTTTDGLYAYSLNLYHDSKPKNMSSYDDLRNNPTGNIQDLFVNVLSNISNFILPQANASFMKLFGGLGAGVATIFLLKKAFGNILDTMLGSPYKRAIAYSVMGAMAFMSSKKNEELVKRIEERINMIDAILNRFRAFKKVNAIINDGINQGGKTMRVPIRVGTPIGTSAKPFPCLNKSQSGKCLSTNSAIQQGITDSKLNLPDGVSSMAGLAGSTADGVAGKSKLDAGTVDGLNSLASNAGNIDRINKSLQDRLNKLRKKNGQRPINFRKAKNDLLDKLKGSMFKTLRKNGISGNKALAAVAPSVAPSYFRSRNKDNSNKKLTKRKSAEATPTGSGNLNNGGGFQFNLDKPAGEELNIADGEGIDAEAELDGLEEGELEVDDIVQDENVSIFKVISVRYFKSGYPRVLRRKEDIEPKADSK